MKHLFAAALLLASAYAEAATVYKCKDANGAPIYSQQPCAKDPAKVQEMQVRGIGKEDAEAAQRVREAAADERITANLDRNERNCIAAKTDAAWRPANRRIAASEREKASLTAQLQNANNNLAGATWQSGLRQQISTIDQAIATERSTASQIERDGIRQCSDARAGAE